MEYRAVPKTVALSKKKKSAVCANSVANRLPKRAAKILLMRPIRVCNKYFLLAGMFYSNI